MKSLSIFLFTFLIFYSFIDQGFQDYQRPENRYYDKAFDFRDTNSDSALVNFQRARDLFLEQGDSLGVGKCLVNLAINATNKGDYFSGQELSLQALPYFHNGNRKHHVYLQANYNNLGLATYRVNNYRKSLEYYDEAIKFAVDSSAIRTYLNNKGNSYRELGNYHVALLYYKRSLNGSISQLEHARAITNFSFTKWLQNSNYNAAPELLRALSVREKAKDFLDQNSSFAHLSDFYAKKRRDSALFFAFKMYDAATQAQSADDRLTALRKIMTLGSESVTKRYFLNYIKLSDSVETSRWAAKNQFILIVYEVEKNKADKLKLQKDNAEKQFQIAARELWLTGAVLLFIAGAIIITLWYKKRKQKMNLEAQSAIRTSQLKTSKKVHDVVANGIYRAMAEIENQDEFDRERILDVLDEVYKKSRDISYEAEPVAKLNPDFDERIAQLVKSFRTSQLTIELEGNNKGLWLNVSKPVREEIQHVLQEFFVNMKKHSRADHVSLKFEFIENRIHISYADNGIGISGEINFKNGLGNTVNRIKAISGIITFDTTVARGVKILISVPVS